MNAVKVISQQPPAGRCTLYARYAETISDVLGWSHSVVHDECRDAHGNGFPSLWIRDNAIQPADGVILAPEDICDFLKAAGVPAAQADALLLRLQAILDDFLASWNP
jgi:cystathionine gamma-synthase